MNNSVNEELEVNKVPRDSSVNKLSRLCYWVNDLQIIC